MCGNMFGFTDEEDYSGNNFYELLVRVINCDCFEYMRTLLCCLCTPRL